MPDAARCRACSARIVIVPAGALAVAARTPVLAFSETFHEVFSSAAPLEAAASAERADGPFLVLRDDGVLQTAVGFFRALQIREMAEAPYLSLNPVRGRVPHRFSCPVRRNGEGVGKPGDGGICEGCKASIFWIETKAGRHAPLDPTPHSGKEIGLADARAFSGNPRLVVGLDINGRMAAILEYDAASLDSADGPTTVWVNHFATCTNPPKRSRPSAKSRAR